MGCKSLKTGMRETIVRLLHCFGFLTLFLVNFITSFTANALWKMILISWWLSELTYRKKLHAGMARRDQLVTLDRSWWLSLCKITCND